MTPADDTGTRVLVVDDTPANVRLLEALLTPLGYQVHTASSGEEALEVIHGSEVDLVLLDIGLPDMDGYAVAEQLRGRSALVALTGYGGPQDAERARGAGCTHHLVKPADPVLLRQILADVPRRARSVGD